MVREDVHLLVFREWEPAASEGPDLALRKLTRRQQEIVELLVHTGLSYKEIADRLHISDGTMRKHVENIRGRLGVHSRAELMPRLRAR